MPGTPCRSSGVARGTAGELQQRRFAHHLEGRAIQTLGLLLAVLEERLEDRGLRGRELARTLDPPERGRLRAALAGIAAQPRQAIEFLVGLRPMAGPGQRLELPVAQRHEVVGVEPGVVQLFRRQRPALPVGALILLVHRHAELSLENGGQPDLRPAERARRAHGVEDVRELEVVVAPEADQVVFGGVKHFLLIAIGEDGGERARDPRA